MRIVQHFVLKDNMLEVDCPSVTPEIVLKASGHVEKFTDLMVKDEVTGDCYRADHLVKEDISLKLAQDPNLDEAKVHDLKHTLAVLDDLNAEQLGAKLKELGIKSPNKNALSEPYPFNLMFATSIGPAGNAPGYVCRQAALISISQSWQSLVCSKIGEYAASAVIYALRQHRGYLSTSSIYITTTATSCRLQLHKLVRHSGTR